MADIHPHWQTTGDERPTAVGTPTVRDIEPKHTISRKPAAIAGILVVVALGVSFVHGVNTLSGQLSDGIVVTIGASGMTPATVDVLPGQSITWTNEMTVPHILLSDSLCDSTDDCLYTDTMFEGDSYTYTVPLDIAGGTYAYRSATDASITGTVNVLSSTEPETTVDDETPLGTETDTSDAEVEALFEELESAPPTDEEAVTFTTQETVAEETITQAPPVALPTNPYTVNSGSSNNDSGLHSGAPLQPVTQHRPFTQPQTGPGAWLIAIAGLVAFWFVSRKIQPATLNK